MGILQFLLPAWFSLFSWFPFKCTICVQYLIMSPWIWIWSSYRVSLYLDMSVVNKVPCLPDLPCPRLPHGVLPSKSWRPIHSLHFTSTFHHTPMQLPRNIFTVHNSEGFHLNLFLLILKDSHQLKSALASSPVGLLRHGNSIQHSVSWKGAR